MASSTKAWNRISFTFAFWNRYDHQVVHSTVLGFPPERRRCSPKAHLSHATAQPNAQPQVCTRSLTSDGQFVTRNLRREGGRSGAQGKSRDAWRGRPRALG